MQAATKGKQRTGWDRHCLPLTVGAPLRVSFKSEQADTGLRDVLPLNVSTRILVSESGREVLWTLMRLHNPPPISVYVYMGPFLLSVFMSFREQRVRQLEITR